MGAIAGDDRARIVEAGLVAGFVEAGDIDIDERERRRRNRISLIGCLGMLGGIALLTVERSGAEGGVWSGMVRASVPDLAPTRGIRLAPALIPAPTTAEYRFQRLRSDGRPVGYDPCRPVEIIVNPAGGPPNSLDLVTEVAAELSANSGLDIRVRGLTDEPASLDLVEGDGISWERAPMEQLASSGQLMAFEHGGFWQPMDTLREKMLLEGLWNSGHAPWKRWGA